MEFNRATREAKTLGKSSLKKPSHSGQEPKLIQKYPQLTAQCIQIGMLYAVNCANTNASGHAMTTSANLKLTAINGQRQNRK